MPDNSLLKKGVRNRNGTFMDKVFISLLMLLFSCWNALVIISKTSFSVDFKFSSTFSSSSIDLMMLANESLFPKDNL